MATEYVMRAFKTTVPTGHVYWSSIGAPDLVGDQSGYNPADLTSITTDYTLETPVNGNPQVPAGLAGGDLSGSYPDPVVAKIQTRAVSSTSPSDGDLLTWDQTDGYWRPAAATGTGTQILMSVISYTYAELTALSGVFRAAVFQEFTGGGLPDTRIVSCEIENTFFAAPGLSSASAQIVTVLPNVQGITGFSDLMLTDGYSAPPPQFIRTSLGAGEQPQLQISLSGDSFANLTSGSIIARLFYYFLEG